MGLSLLIRKTLRKVLLRLGYELRPLQADGWRPVYHHIDGELTRFEPPRWDASYLRGLGFNPRTIIDVGVAGGTPSLYAAFPDAHLVLIEPQPEYEAEMRTILEKRKGSYHLLAAGDHAGQVELMMDPERERATLYERVGSEIKSGPAGSITVPMTTLDKLHNKMGFAPPFGLKIDAEGAEMAVLLGAERVLRDTQFVVVESPLVERFKGGCTLKDIVVHLDAAGFALRDILDIGRAIPSDEATFFDAVFAR